MSIVSDHLRDDCMRGAYNESESIKDYISENHELKMEVRRLAKQITVLNKKLSDRSWSDHTQMGRY